MSTLCPSPISNPSVTFLSSVSIFANNRPPSQGGGNGKEQIKSVKKQLTPYKSTTYVFFEILPVGLRLAIFASRFQRINLTRKRKT